MSNDQPHSQLSSDPEASYLGSTDQYSRRIQDIEYREAVTCRWDTPVWQAAGLMAEKRVSCLFITGNSGHIDGYLTDILLRDRVIAQQADTGKAVVYFMDKDVRRIKKTAFVYQALLTMFRTKSRYLLVTDEDSDSGFLSRNRLLGEQAESPLVFIQSIKSTRNIETMASKWQQAPAIVRQLLRRGVQAEIVNQVITAIADTIAQNCVDIALQELGPPPARFAFLVLGSEGRKEQTLKTDQDNGIIYEDVDPESQASVSDYFMKLGTRLAELLNHAGFAYCSGGFMASNPAWNAPLSKWKVRYRQWLEDALPESAIQFSTFFDARLLYGEAALMRSVRDLLEEELQQPLEKFFFFITRNALQYNAPKDFFRGIKTFKLGDRDVFDIKKTMALIVDLVRVYALRNRLFTQNTGERIDLLRDMNVFSEKQHRELKESYYFLMSMRLEHQANQLLSGSSEADNFIGSKGLSDLDKASLKSIFKTIDAFQASIRIKFSNNLLG